MQKFKNVYSSNTIVQFLISYVFVLIIPLIIISYGFQIAFQVVESDIKKTNQYVLEHGIDKIDGDLKSIRALGLQMAQSELLKDFANQDVVDNSYYSSAMAVINEYYSTMRYQGISILDDTYVYLKLRDKVLYENTLYRPEIFTKYLNIWGLDIDEWRALCENEGSRKPNYKVTSNGGIQYVVPFSKELKGDNLGVIVYRISNNGIRKYLDFLDEYSEYSIFIIDGNGNTVWAEDKLGYSDKINEDWLKGNDIARTRYEDITYASSETFDWQYVLVLPRRVALNHLIVLKTIVISLIVAAITLGLLISIIMSIRKGRPINALTKLFKNIERKEVSLSNMGEIVTGILKDNESLLVEHENDKPSLQKAFFHDLIKAEFVNSTELNYMAKKAGIELAGKNYCVVSFKLFFNNDFYQIDEQTMEEVRIISQLVQKHIYESYHESVWFYKRNTLVTLGIFKVSSEVDVLRTLIEQTSYWLLNEYSVETSWGLSAMCNNLLEVWKSCEEASVAMENCGSKRHITEYSTGLEMLDEFYFPYIIEEKLMSSMKSGDTPIVINMLNMLEEENFVIRSLDRQRFIKFNRRMTDLLCQYENTFPWIREKIIWLNAIVIDNYGDYKEYFARLSSICMEICTNEENKKNDKRKKVIKEIIIYINENYMDSGLGLGKVGSEFGMSEGYLSSIFKEITGRNFAEYLEEIRIETACTLLKDYKCSIGTIGEQVGYNSIQSFRRAFKRVKGSSPREYRD